ncbi:MAG: hypothetical protein LBC59_03730 [Chitinispirillales bacterium]|jgi:hypothetical protein|nr:hypothetical protein [Chitinispirillales bacterium]
MSATIRTVEKILGKDIVKRGDRTEDRKEILKNLTGAEIDAEADRLVTRYPGRFTPPKEIHEKIRRLQKDMQMAGCLANAVGA